MSEPFDLKTFLGTLVFCDGEIKVPKIELITNEKKAAWIYLLVPGTDEPLGVGVLWMPEANLLRFTFNLDLSLIEIDTEEEAGRLFAIINFINDTVWDRIGKLTAHQDEESGTFIGNVVFTICPPDVLLNTEDGLRILREFVSTSIFRLLAEGTTISLELHEAWRTQDQIEGEARLV